MILLNFLNNTEDLVLSYRPNDTQEYLPQRQFRREHIPVLAQSVFEPAHKKVLTQ
jgi:hypothetical protein